MENMRVRKINGVVFSDTTIAGQQEAWFNITAGAFKHASVEVTVRIDAAVDENPFCTKTTSRFEGEPSYDTRCGCDESATRPCVFDTFERSAGMRTMWERKSISDRCIKCPDGFLKFDLAKPPGIDSSDTSNMYYSKKSFDWIFKGKIIKTEQSQGPTYCETESKNGGTKANPVNVYQPFRGMTSILTQPGWWRLREDSSFWWKCDLQPGAVRQEASHAPGGPMTFAPIRFKQYCSHWKQEGTWQQRVCNDEVGLTPTPAPVGVNGTAAEKECTKGTSQIYVADNAQCLKWETCYNRYPRQCPFPNVTKNVNVTWEHGTDESLKIEIFAYSFKFSEVPWQGCGGTASNSWDSIAPRNKETGAASAEGDAGNEDHAPIVGTTNGPPHFGKDTLSNEYMFPPLYWINEAKLAKVVASGYDAANGHHAPPHPLHRPILQVIPEACSQCKGGHGGDENLCGANYRGKLCAACQPNYGKNGKFCEPCSEPDDNAPLGLTLDKLAILVFVGLASIVVSAMVWSTIKAGKDIERSLNEDVGKGYAGEKGSMKEAQLKISLLAKMLVNYLQFTSFAKQIDIQWPPVIQNMFATQETLSMVNTFSMSQIDCVLAAGKNATMNRLEPENMKLFFDSWTLHMLLPVTFIIIAFCFWIFRYLMARFVGKGCFKKKLPFEQTKANMIITMLVLLFFAHPTIVKQVLMMFDCRVLDIKDNGEEESYLVSDFYVNCDSPEYRYYARWGFACMVGWALGIPLSAAYAIKVNIKAIRYEFVGEIHPDYDEVLHFKKLKAISRFGFLFKGYEERDICPYWEVSVIMIRKTLMIILMVYLKYHPIQVQMLFGSLLIVIFLVLHVKYEPFDDDDLDSLETWSLLCSFLTLFLGLFFEVAKDYPTWMTPIAWTILAVNGFVFSMFVFHFLHIATSFARGKMKAAKEAKLKEQLSGGVTVTVRKQDDAASGPPQPVFEHGLFGKPVPEHKRTVSRQMTMAEKREQAAKEEAQKAEQMKKSANFRRWSVGVDPDPEAESSTPGGPPQPVSPQPMPHAVAGAVQMVPMQMVPVQMVPAQMVPAQMVPVPTQNGPTPGGPRGQALNKVAVAPAPTAGV
jgi:hypothetical protein